MAKLEEWHDLKMIICGIAIGIGFVFVIYGGYSGCCWWGADVSVYIERAKQGDMICDVKIELAEANKLIIGHNWWPTLDEYIERAERIEKIEGYGEYQCELWNLKNDLDSYRLPIREDLLFMSLITIGAFLVVVGFIGADRVVGDC